MKIKELKPGLSDIQLEGRVIVVESAKAIQNKEDKSIKTRKEFIIGDETGTVRVILWNTDVNVKQGDAIRITDAWTIAYRDQVQVQAGKWSKIEKIDDKTVPPIEQIPDTMPSVPEYRVPIKRKQS
mgnify:CR=1 FL=1